MDEIRRAKILTLLSKVWTPHQGQVQAGQAVFNSLADLVYVECGRKFGKALDISEYLPTPEGFRQVKDIEVGDCLMGPDGKPTEVINATEIHNRESYELELCDGTTIIASDNHKWSVRTKSDRKHGYSARVLTTKEMYAEGLSTASDRPEWQFSIDAISPVQYSVNTELEVHPYTLGAWLGDGNSYDGQFSSVDIEVLESIENSGYTVSNSGTACAHYILDLKTSLKRLNVLQNKHIPEEYLVASVSQRLALLQGLMDTDGTCTKAGHCVFYNTNKTLVDGVAEIVRSLGYKCKIRTKTPKISGQSHGIGGPYKTCYMVYFQTDPNIHPAFTLPRKLERQRAPAKPQHRFIVNIRPVGVRPVRCFEVANDLHEFLVGRHYTRTHNSEFACYCCWLYAIMHDNAEVYYLAPAVKQAKELVWYNSRMQTCNTYDMEFLSEIERLMGGEVKVLYHEARILLPNGSFIKVDGSDNYNTQRGLKPDFVVADEYRDFKEQWIEATRPNMMVKQGKILFITTPPHGPNHAYRMAEECKRGVRENDDHYFYLNLPSYCNDRLPHNREWLDNEKKRLEAEGRHNEWRREYMAEYISADEHAVIPQLNRDLVEPEDVLLDAIRKTPEKLTWFVTIDPWNTTKCAALIGVFTPISPTIYILDEILEDNSQKTNICAILAKIESKLQKFNYPGLDQRDVVYMYNCKCPWFEHDIAQTTIKAPPAVACPLEYKDVTFGLNLLKDSILSRRLRVSDTCKNLITESELYIRHHESGEIPKEPRQLINCLRYSAPAVGFTWEHLDLVPPLPPDEEFLRKLGLTPEDLMAEHANWVFMDEDFGHIDLREDFLLGDERNL